MGKVTVTFEAENQDELLADMRQFCGGSATTAVTPPVTPPEQEKPKTRGRKSKKDKEAEEAAAAAKAPAATLDLGGNESPPAADLPTPTHPELVEALTTLQASKGDAVTIQIMEEFGGSTKMMDIPEENYALLFAEAVKATNG